MAVETRKVLREQVTELRARLEEAEEVLRALREGEADAIVAKGPDGDRVYTLKGADESYRILVEEMGAGAATVTAEGLILFANGPLATMLGRPLERMMGARIGDFVVEADAALVETILRGEGRRKAEVRLLAWSGELVPVYLSVRNLVLHGEECRCVVVTDLSEQKRTAEIAAVLEVVPVGVFIAGDAQCRRIVGNRAANEMLRCPAGRNVSKSALGGDAPKNWVERWDGREIPVEDLPMQKAARTGQAVRDVEFEVLFDDGVVRCWLGSAVPLFDEFGETRGAVGAFKDVTERRKTREALEIANVELRGFGNVLSEDLREPVREVVRFARQLAGEREDVATRGALAAALRVEALVQGLVDYWAVTEGGCGSVAEVDCNAILERTMVDLGEVIRTSGATVMAGRLPTVQAEESMLMQVFRTLLDNAIRYRGEEAPRIRISAECTFDRWLFSVRDNGMGIESKNTETVFGMFKRLHGSEIPGTGISLALCRKMVERQGGRIWVEPVAGRGAAFRFTIPISLAGAP